MEMMQEMKKNPTLRDKPSVFLRELDCLRLIDLGQTIEFETAQIDIFDKKSKCAIASWSWKPSKHENEVADSCFIEDEAGERKCSEVRDSVWRRAAAYMLHMGVEYLWIDAECIDQKDSEEKEKAMQEMDWLYHYGAHPFGMLTRPVDSEVELNLLAQILQGELACQSGHDRELPLKKGSAIASAREAIRLLDEITSDIWWTRAWIYQENYHGGQRMRLLMPHNLKSLKAKDKDLFGDLEGELIISSIRLSEALTEICSGFITWSAPDDPQQEAAHRILSRAARYSVLLEDRYSMSPVLIADVVNRCVTNHPDRLPIIANCCSYNVRLDSKMLQKRGISASLAILVMFLLNGEVFHNVPDERRPDTVASESSDLTFVKFIQKYAFNKFNPPFPKNELTFNKSCRFVDVSLEADGVHTSGHLWKLCEKAISIPRRQLQGLDTVESLWVLHEYIEGLPGKDEISCMLREFLINWKEPESPAEEYMRDMAEKVADALHDGRKLLLGHLCNPSRNTGSSSPTGIFICPDEASESHGSAFVFTSFRPSRKTSDGPSYTSDVDKHVSLQVGVNHDEGAAPKLFARAWMHGLWFWTKSPEPVIFPLPSILNEL